MGRLRAWVTGLFPGEEEEKGGGVVATGVDFVVDGLDLGFEAFFFESLAGFLEEFDVGNAEAIDID